jgi:hypothetical protein
VALLVLVAWHFAWLADRRAQAMTEQTAAYKAAQAEASGPSRARLSRTANRNGGWPPVWRTRNMMRNWPRRAPWLAISMLTACGPKVLKVQAAQPQPLPRPTLPAFAKDCPPMVSWYPKATQACTEVTA